MSFTRYHIAFLIVILLSAFNTKAQRNCGTVEYNNQLGNTETKDVLEDWILQKQIEAPSSLLKSFNQDGITVYQIPVVVHIVHNGEAVGVGSNISNLQIQSQIDVLNEDFGRMNADSINIPSEFKPLYANIEFEFILAKRDPINAATNGITRVQGSKTSWNINSSDNIELKSHDYWPSEDYLNIWVAPLCCTWLGWAQFPQSDVLAGLDPPYNATTDGIVITYDAFGSISKDPSADLQPKFDLGRTTTHEIGHFFGLRHTWGDGGCGIDDYVNDTPIAEDNYTGCPIVGASSTSCGSQDMFMNYMDYTDDVCMNIFSIGQKDRMLIIMENSPRRLSLTQSTGLLPLDSDDLALISFISPTQGICDSQINPIFSVKNVGINFINSANISLYINDNLVATQDFILGLAINETTDLAFGPIDLTNFGDLEFKAKVNTINGTPDLSENNNTLTTTSLRAEPVLYLLEDFSTSNSLWTVRSNQESSALEKSQSVFYNTTNNSAAFNFYKFEPSTDLYISPKLLLSTDSPTLFFDYAYAYRGFEDELSVWLSTDCGNTFENLLFSAVGEELSTANSPVSFYPSSALDWQHVQINLSSYANQEVIFSFNGKSDGGNRILFDNIRVENKAYNDIALSGLVSPATNCGTQNEVIISVVNKGTTTLKDLILVSSLNSSSSTITYPQLNLLPGESVDLTMPTVSFQGKSQLRVSIENDDNNENNEFEQTIISASTVNVIPLREKFEDEVLPENWALVGSTNSNDLGWQLNNNRLEFIAETSTAKGLNEIIVLPPLNLANLNSASMHFSFAYAYDGFNEELLKVRATKDCGETYETLFIEGGEELATNFTTTPWFPSSAADWRNVYVDLTEFVGNENVQLIIELSSAKGNNAFVTDIELFASNIIIPLELAENTITAFPNPSFSGSINIGFNLSKVQSAKMLIYNAKGIFVVEKDIPTALNQTFKVTTAHLQNGIYFARIIGSEVDISRSFIISN